LFKDGQAVKVIAPVTLFSVPKHPDGISIQGMTGEVFKDVSQFKGKVLSANLPYVVKFKTTLNGADVKFQAHLVSFPQEGPDTQHVLLLRGTGGNGGKTLSLMQLCLTCMHDSNRAKKRLRQRDAGMLGCCRMTVITACSVQDWTSGYKT
jgi:hypothetical protein